MRKLSQREKGQFYHQLSRQVASGIPLPRGIELLAESRRGRIGKLAGRLARLEGTISERFAACDGQFSGLETGLLDAGERSGALETSLNLLEEYFEQMARTRRRILSASIYPLVVFHLAALLLALPPAVMAQDSTVFFQQAGLVLGVFYALLLALWIVLRTLGNWGARFYPVDSFLTAIPLIGSWRLDWISSEFSTVLSLQVQAGTGILAALRRAGRACQSPRISHATNQIIEKVKQGESFSRSLRAAGCFPQILEDAVSTGEESGRLDTELLRAAATLREKTHRILDQIASWSPKILYAAVVLYTAYRIILTAQSYYASLGEMFDL